MTHSHASLGCVMRSMVRLFFCFAVVAMLTTSASAALHPGGSAAALRASYAAMQSEIEHSAFGKPLWLESTETSAALAGEIHAAIDFPFDVVRTALREARNWCEILILHPNIEHCRIASASGAGETWIAVDLGRTQVPVSFSWHVIASDADYLHVQLAAADGPFGTTDYRIDLEAAPLAARRTMLQLTFSHGYGMRARFAMQTYLAMFGRDKVGFTIVDRTADGHPRYIGDFRGALERNVMRYYLAIEAYLQSLSAPPARQREARLMTWFSYTQRYARQLHEDDNFLDRKRAQLARQPVVS